MMMMSRSRFRDNCSHTGHYLFLFVLYVGSHQSIGVREGGVNEEIAFHQWFRGH